MCISYFKSCSQADIDLLITWMDMTMCKGKSFFPVVITLCMLINFYGCYRLPVCFQV